MWMERLKMWAFGIKVANEQRKQEANERHLMGLEDFRSHQIESHLRNGSTIHKSGYTDTTGRTNGNEKCLLQPNLPTGIQHNRTTAQHNEEK
jgi:hypothetical protein